MIFSWLIFLKEKIIGDNWLLEFFDGNSSCFATQMPFLRYRSGLGEIILFKPWYCFDSFHSVSFTSPSQKLWSSSYSEWNFFIPYLSKSLVQFRNCVFKLLLQQILDSSVYKNLRVWVWWKFNFHWICGPGQNIKIQKSGNYIILFLAMLNKRWSKCTTWKSSFVFQDQFPCHTTSVNESKDLRPLHKAKEVGETT